MWCYHLRRVAQLFSLSGQKSLLTGSRCCVAANCKYERTESTSSQHTRCKHGQTYQRWSRSHIVSLAAGVGLSLAAYKLVTTDEALLAVDEDTPDKEGESTEGETKINKENKEDGVDWSKVPELPTYVPYILIGGGTASLEAFKAIKTSDVKAKVLMITDELHSPYYRPILSKEFFFDENPNLYKNQEYTNSRGKINSIYQMEGLYMEPKKLDFAENGGLALLQGKKVIRLDPNKKTVTLDDGRKIGFGKCLVATGGKPKNLEVFETACPEVRERTMLFRNYEDSAKLIERVEKSESIAVIGGGFLGSELSVGLAYRSRDTDANVYQVYPEKGIFSRVLPDYLSEWTTKQTQQAGVKHVPMVEVLAATYEDGKVRLVLTNGQVLHVDQIVVTVGIQPNTDLAQLAGLETDKRLGGYVVNGELQARSNIWAAGDCACFYDSKLGRRRVEHFDHAALTGRLAGFNMTGESNTFRYQSVFWSTLGGILTYEAVGLIDSSLQTFGTFLPPADAKKEDLTEGVLVSPADMPEEFSKGVIFYLRDDIVVGIVLWNIDAFSGNPPRMDIAKQIIQNGAKNQNLIEVAKLFNIHSKPGQKKDNSKEDQSNSNSNSNETKKQKS